MPNQASVRKSLEASHHTQSSCGILAPAHLWILLLGSRVATHARNSIGAPIDILITIGNGHPAAHPSEVGVGVPQDEMAHEGTLVPHASEELIENAVDVDISKGVASACSLACGLDALEIGVPIAVPCVLHVSSAASRWGVVCVFARDGRALTLVLLNVALGVGLVGESDRVGRVSGVADHAVRSVLDGTSDHSSSASLAPVPDTVDVASGISDPGVERTRVEIAKVSARKGESVLGVVDGIVNARIVVPLVRSSEAAPHDIAGQCQDDSECREPHGKGEE